MDEAFSLFENWIRKQKINPWEKDAICDMMNTCMQQNVFQFRNKFYKQNRGTAMGHPCSPLFAELYMADLETRISKNKLFPRFWRRYVDDIFAIVKRNNIREIVEWLNNISATINFTHEMETNGKLPFLDIEISRTTNNTLEFNIYRKPTSTNTFINA